MKKWILLSAVIGLMAGSAAISRADDLADLKQQLAELQKKVDSMEAKQKQAPAPAADADSAQKLQKRMDELELAQAQAAATQERQNAALAQKMEMGTLPSNLAWLDNIKFSGDIRTRFEEIDQEGYDNVNRARFRARLGLDVTLGKEWFAGLRLASDTGTSSDPSKGGDPTSTNQTFGDSWSKDSIYIDLAYIDYRPLAAPGLDIFAGKMNNPFYTVGKNQLIWDSDLTPEGFAATYKTPLNSSLELFTNGGGFYVTQSSTSRDVTMWGGQAGLKHSWDPDTYLLGGAGWYTFGSIEGAGTLDNNKKTFFGNTYRGSSVANGKYVSGYDIAEGFVEYGMLVGKLPVSVYGDYARNTAATTDQDTAWLVGASLNKVKKAGSWTLNYDYRSLQKDAVVGAFSDSDFIGGGTDGNGHRFGGTYALTDNVTTGLTYFMDNKGGSDGSVGYDRLQADLMVKF